MAWIPADALRYVQEATSEGLCRLWADVANMVLAETRNEAYALLAAQAAVASALENEHFQGVTSEIGDFNRPFIKRSSADSHLPMST
jgi:hypothetical protein